MGKMLDSTLSWIFEKMAKAYVHRTGSNLPDAKVPVVQDVDGKPYFNLSSIGSADLSKLSGANALDGTIAEAISGLRTITTGYFKIKTIAGQVIKVTSDLVIEGTLPPNNRTFFVPRSQSKDLAYVSTIGYDASKLFVYSNLSQNTGYFWVNVS